MNPPLRPVGLILAMPARCCRKLLASISLDGVSVPLTSRLISKSTSATRERGTEFRLSIEVHDRHLVGAEKLVEGAG